jgi:hypothetical protein
LLARHEQMRLRWPEYWTLLGDVPAGRHSIQLMDLD